MESTAAEPKGFLPLTPVAFHILMALSDEERHGYGIMKEVEASTEGRVTIQTGTLYLAIKRLLDAGLIRQVESKVDPAMDDKRRRYYALSGLGRQVLEEESLRLERMTALARFKQVLDPGKAGFIMGQA